MKHIGEYTFEIIIKDQNGVYVTSSKGNLDELDDCILVLDEEIDQYDRELVSAGGIVEKQEEELYEEVPAVSYEQIEIEEDKEEKPRSTSYISKAMSATTK